MMKQAGWESIDLLKIDIEGAERFILTDKKTSDFLEKVKILALEIHDEFNIRSAIYDVLRQHQFTITNHGETTIAFK